MVDGKDADKRGRVDAGSLSLVGILEEMVLAKPFLVGLLVVPVQV